MPQSLAAIFELLNIIPEVLKTISEVLKMIFRVRKMIPKIFGITSGNRKIIRDLPHPAAETLFCYNSGNLLFQ